MAASGDVESCVGDTTVQRRWRLLGAATTGGAGVLQDGAIFCYEGAMGFLLDRGASTDGDGGRRGVAAAWWVALAVCVVGLALTNLLL